MLSNGTPMIPHLLDFAKSSLDIADSLDSSSSKLHKSTDSAEKANFHGSKVLKSMLSRIEIN